VNDKSTLSSPKLIRLYFQWVSNPALNIVKRGPELIAPLKLTPERFFLPGTALPPDNHVGVKPPLLPWWGREDFGQRIGQLGPDRDAPSREPGNSASGLVSADVAPCFSGPFLLMALEGSLLALTDHWQNPQIDPSEKSPIFSGRRCSV
jgi:hypothetical protein